MKRLATFAWRSPPPTSVDESLALFDDGSAWLLVRRPHDPTGSVGTFAAPIERGALDTLTAPGPGPVAFDLLDREVDAGLAALRIAADGVAAAVRATPRAVATFHAGPLAVTGAMLSMSLLVVGAGTKAVELELDPARCTVHFEAAGQAVGWVPLPELGSGFVTPDAVGLGGLRRPARVRPGEYGATAFSVPVPGGATRVAIEVAGWLTGALPDERLPGPFAVRTAAAEIPGVPPVLPGG